MNHYSLSFTSLAILAASVTSVGCAYVPKGGAKAPSLAPTSADVAPGKENAGTAGSNAVSNDVAARGGAAKAVPAAEKKLAALFPNEAHYSAATVQGKGSPLCPATNGATPLSLWLTDGQQGPDCFVMNEHASHANFETFKSLRDAQDYGMLSKPKAAMIAKGGVLFANLTNGKLWASEYVGGVARLLEIDCEKGRSVDSGLVFRNVEHYCDVSAVRFDVLTKDAALAKGMQLATEETQFKGRALELLKGRGAAAEKRDLEAAAKVKFPAAVTNDAKVLEAVKRYIAENPKKADIDAKKIKKVAMTEDWRVTKSPIGLIMHRKGGVTVGFERSDETASDPNKKCALTTLEVQEDHDGIGFGKPFATGLASAWTTIPCARLQ